MKPWRINSTSNYNQPNSIAAKSPARSPRRMGGASARTRYGKLWEYQLVAVGVVVVVVVVVVVAPLVVADDARVSIL